MNRIPATLFEFLEGLKKNNNRDWFEDHKKEFKSLQQEMKQFNEAVFEDLKTHDDVDSYKMFRIYRDVRFSKNKTPYKTNFGCSFHRVKPALRGGYYLHLEPDASFLAIGFWAPEKDDLFRIRKEFEMDAEEFREIVDEKQFKITWGTLEGEELKTAPKGFDKEDPNIDLIRKKQYVFTKKFTNNEVLSEDFQQKIGESFTTARPFLDLMSDILTTDLNGASVL
ncbi:TIGR02453 family protein [Pustulibacterium marinum]|uniref:TIGR02453 family protein n=1 Tax=Pustulibacterium marinum TaxID=1224947 RepID=A0A1I7I0H2_9FLAO|nr:DUF2461 domain-containing protein [Pustulibacterium marinum]SFU66449.1 TIGR02453 family protein [Pustulibacterium marinum]